MSEYVAILKNVKVLHCKDKMAWVQGNTNKEYGSRTPSNITDEARLGLCHMESE